MMNAANENEEDLAARGERLVRIGIDLMQRAALPMTAKQQAELETEMRANTEALQQVVDATRADTASMLRQLRTLGGPTLRRVVTDANGNTVIF